MEKVYAKDLKNFLGCEISFSGFVDSIRNLQWVMFVILRDSTGKVQVTIEKSEEKNKAFLEVFESLPLESTVKVRGILSENEKVKLNGCELLLSDVEVTSKSAPELPFSFKDLSTTTLDTRLDYRFIDMRNERVMAQFQVQSAFVKYLREYLYEHEFTEIHTPKLIGAASESGSEVFHVDYFDGDAYLAQSPQFYKQMAMASGMSKVFEVGPCFRAENSNTNKHATEFTSFDVEFSYIDSFDDVMTLESEMLEYALRKLKENEGEKIKELFGIEITVPKLPFPKLTLKEAYKEIKENYGYSIPEEEQVDLTTEAEKLLGRLSLEKYGNEFIFITDYPAEKRAFYHMRKDGILQGYDLIWKGVEITTGAQREHRYEEIVKNAEEKGLKDDVKFYLEFFHYGCPPHGGFAIGVDRLTMLLLGIPSVKETQFLFRGPNRLNP